MSNKLNKLSVFVSLILRHKPETIGISLDGFGYANVKQLIDGINASGRTIDFDSLCQIVSEDTKGRYSFNEDKTLIRANQGHSIPVNVPLTKTIPPDVLFHGTASKNVDIIMREGIKKMNRLYVHLSDNLQTANQVGQRHGSPVIFLVDAKRMNADGLDFYLSENGVWLVDFVPSEYLSLQ